MGALLAEEIGEPGARDVSEFVLDNGESEGYDHKRSTIYHV